MSEQEKYYRDLNRQRKANEKTVREAEKAAEKSREAYGNHELYE